MCSEEFNKCYVVVGLTYLAHKDRSFVWEITWEESLSKLCGVYNWSLVNIHSKLEQDFVGYYLKYKLLYPKRKEEILSNNGIDLGYKGNDGYAYLGNVSFLSPDRKGSRYIAIILAFIHLSARRHILLRSITLIPFEIF